MHCQNLGWRVRHWVAAPEVLQLPACGVSADEGDLRSHQSGIFEWAGGIGAEVFGIVRKAESGLFDSVGRKSAESLRVGNYT
ncbi:hypothetical protein H6G97_35870 [Nostoc flagelliforme FACHB-838]|uniref:Uncharacterized protein n=1 Tax=Nostoc flagelliforme FACHB-838 TaxID=2692904 RepID=A0ABR8DYS1_9NOSO|nr:hypothetical protein [Nostoc flagelliforme]MBD2534571.1 hypothetical protein [Nostoc flagelliforme FACHB-838]